MLNHRDEFPLTPATTNDILPLTYGDDQASEPQGLTLDEIAAWSKIPREFALVIVSEHGQPSLDFFIEFGDHPYYDGKDILEWLGY